MISSWQCYRWAIVPLRVDQRYWPTHMAFNSRVPKTTPAFAFEMQNSRGRITVCDQFVGIQRSEWTPTFEWTWVMKNVNNSGSLHDISYTDIDNVFIQYIDQISKFLVYVIYIFLLCYIPCCGTKCKHTIKVIIDVLKY